LRAFGVRGTLTQAWGLRGRKKKWQRDCNGVTGWVAYAENLIQRRKKKERRKRRRWYQGFAVLSG